PVKATQIMANLKVEVGPVEGSYPGMLKSRAYELRLPADWPPVEVKINGVVLKPAHGMEKGWSYEGNTLTTVIPVPSHSVLAKVTVEVRRAGETMQDDDKLDGFAGAMTRLRAATEAMHQTQPAADAPDELIDAWQAGDRMSYHPENAQAEIAHFHEVLPRAQAAVADIGKDFAEHLEERINRYSPQKWLPGGIDMQVQKQRRLDAMARAQRLMDEANK
ncbi:MAG: DUF5110 domain-containing protein, partial [Terracidiphilus sp.]